MCSLHHNPNASENNSQPASSIGPGGRAQEQLAEALGELSAIAPGIPEFTLLCKGVATRQPTEAELKIFLEALVPLMGMKVVIPAESWTTPGGHMAAIALDQSSPLLNTWEGGLFKLNIDARRPFCIRTIVEHTREFFGARQFAFAPL